MPKYLTITLARKPLSEGSVAANALKWGTGALNIDASRVGAGSVKQATAGNRTVRWGVGEGGCSYEPGTGARFTTEGRWPANLILSHQGGCHPTGVSQEEATARDDMTPTTHDAPTKFGYSPERHQFNYGGEACTVWDCAEGCPVADLDAQSGKVKTGAWKRQRDGAHPFGGAEGAEFDEWKEVREAPGGASRYFKQVQDS